MKNLLRNSVLALLVSTPLFAAADARAFATSPTFTTGRDWAEKMTPLEKFMSVAAPMAVLDSYGVPFRHSAQTYMPAIDDVIRANPRLLDEDVANIFASALYLFEPESRKPLDELEARFLRGDIEARPVRLLIPELNG